MSTTSPRGSLGTRTAQARASCATVGLSDRAPPSSSHRSAVWRRFFLVAKVPLRDEVLQAPACSSLRLGARAAPRSGKRELPRGHREAGASRRERRGTPERPRHGIPTQSVGTRRGRAAGVLARFGVRRLDAAFLLLCGRPRPLWSAAARRRFSFPLRASSPALECGDSFAAFAPSGAERREGVGLGGSLSARGG